MSVIPLATVLFTVLIVLLTATVLMLRSWLLPQRPVTIHLDDGSTLQTLSGLKLLGTLQEAGYAIPSTCAGAGTCGLCKVTVSKGGGEILSTEKARLSSLECESGIRLACQLTIEKDLSVTLPNDARVADKWTCRVKSTRNLSTLIKEIVLEMPENTSFVFTPGAFVQITAPAFSCKLSDMPIDPAHKDEWDSLNASHLVANTSTPVSRAYSIASIPADTNTIVLLIRLALPPPDHRRDWPPGLVSSWLFNLKNGDKVAVDGPYGDFRVQDNNHDIVLIGGGVGMAPLRAMAHHQLATKSERKIHYYYGARSLSDLFYTEELNRLTKIHENFEWIVALSDASENDQWSGHTGFIHEVVQQEHINNHPHTQQCDYYLCGPPLMLQATVAMLTRAGIPAEQIFADDFG